MTNESPTPARELPVRIGPYLILEEIGAGGMGTVYLGRHAETQQIAAIKQLPPALSREEGFRLRFAREIDALSQLRSPNVVRLYSSGEDHASVYYAMEYVAGETLSQKLKRERRLPWREAVEISLQLCTALKAAHDAGIIHRDLKPSNILLGSDGSVKLSDFGIAQVFASEKLTMTGGVVGTAEYMSPEQALGQRATKRSDLYSLGAVLYVMLTGRPPFVGQNSVEILQKHRFGQFDRPSQYVPEVPRQLDDIVIQLLAKEPEKRFPDAVVLSRQLQQLLQRDAAQLSDAPTTADAEHGAVRTGAAPAGPSAATLMGQLVRAEISRENEPRGLSRAFDNIWVLLTLLALLAGGVWWLLPRGMSEAEQFANAEQLMEQPPGPDWLTARDQWLLPLVTAAPERWQEAATPLLQRIELYELEQRLLSTPRGNSRRKPVPEIERQLRIARRQWDDGQVADAKRRLTAILQFWAQNSEAAIPLQLAQKWLEELESPIANEPDPTELVSRQIAELRSLMQSDPAQARKLRSAITELYGQDPRVQQLIEQLPAAPAE